MRIQHMFMFKYIKRKSMTFNIQRLRSDHHMAENVLNFNSIPFDIHDANAYTFPYYGKNNEILLPVAILYLYKFYIFLPKSHIYGEMMMMAISYCALQSQSNDHVVKSISHFKWSIFICNNIVFVAIYYGI